jgi:hypothetical protein
MLSNSIKPPNVAEVMQSFVNPHGDVSLLVKNRHNTNYGP